jgi:hypothetical protein
LKAITWFGRASRSNRMGRRRRRVRRWRGSPARAGAARSPVCVKAQLRPARPARRSRGHARRRQEGGIAAALVGMRGAAPVAKRAGWAGWHRGCCRDCDSMRSMRFTTVLVTVRASLVDHNHGAGVLVFGSDATLEGVVVSNTQPDGPGRFGRGIGIQMDRETLASGCCVASRTASLGCAGFRSARSARRRCRGRRREVRRVGSGVPTPRPLPLGAARPQAGYAPRAAMRA